MEILISTAKRICLFISWLLFSPLYFILSGKLSTERLGTRALWTFVSPLTLLLIFLFNSPIRFARHSTIGRITEAELPFSVIYNVDGFFNFLSLSDYNTTCDAYFLSIPTEAQYAKLDSMCTLKPSPWSKIINNNEEIYSYSSFWGNGMPAPRGEDKDDDRTLEILFRKGSKKMHIKYGTW